MTKISPAIWREISSPNIPIIFGLCLARAIQIAGCGTHSKPQLPSTSCFDSSCTTKLTAGKNTWGTSTHHEEVPAAQAMLSGSLVQANEWNVPPWPALIGPGNVVTLSKDPPWLLCLTKRSWRLPIVHVLANSKQFLIWLISLWRAQQQSAITLSFHIVCGTYYFLDPKSSERTDPVTKRRITSVLTSWSKRSHQNYSCGLSSLFHPGKNAHVCPPYDPLATLPWASRKYREYSTL